MGQRTSRLAAAVSQLRPWYEPDAQFMWNAPQDTDTATVDPVLGGQLAKTSSGAATISGNYWDMTGSVYNSANGLVSTFSLNNPFLLAVVCDKNNEASSFARLIYFGNEATDSVSFGTGNAATNPVFRLYMAGAALGGVTYASQATWSAKGTALVHWFDFDPTDGTNTILAGVNSTTTTSSGLLAPPAGRTMSRNTSFGNSSGTSGLSSILQGQVQLVSRAGLTRAQKAQIVANMKAKAGI